jgi:predicted branched-subunit amino acid permease
MESLSENARLFKKGLTDGLPIGIGYMPLGIGLSIAACKAGVAFWIWELMSATLFTGSGQGVVLNLIIGGETAVIMYIVSFLIVNLRYLLLSLSMAQKIDKNMTVGQRVLFGFFNTDEIFAVAMQREGKLTFLYLIGIAILPYLGWLSGTVTGFLITDKMPASLSSAFGITLYAMFLALIVPPMRRSFSIMVSVLMAAVINLVFAILPIPLSAGTSMIICSVLTAVTCAILFPVEAQESKGEVEK